MEGSANGVKADAVSGKPTLTRVSLGFPLVSL